MMLRKVLERAREVNLKLNPRKCKFQLDQGHIFTIGGLKADPAKIVTITETITEKLVPTDVLTDVC